MKNPITIKVSVNCIIEKDGKILLVQEAKGRIRGLWSVPGGKVDEGEAFEEAVKREVKEETNLDVFSIEKSYIVQAEPHHTAKHIFKVGADGELYYSEIGLRNKIGIKELKKLSTGRLLTSLLEVII